MCDKAATLIFSLVGCLYHQSAASMAPTCKNENYLDATIPSPRFEKTSEKPNHKNTHGNPSFDRVAYETRWPTWIVRNTRRVTSKFDPTNCNNVYQTLAAEIDWNGCWKVLEAWSCPIALPSCIKPTATTSTKLLLQRLIRAGFGMFWKYDLFTLHFKDPRSAFGLRH